MIKRISFYLQLVNFIKSAFREKMPSRFDYDEDE